MQKQEITIIINPDGTLKIDMEGFKGKACLVMADELEDLLGDRLKRELKPEVYDDADEGLEILTTQL